MINLTSKRIEDITFMFGNGGGVTLKIEQFDNVDRFAFVSYYSPEHIEQIANDVMNYLEDGTTVGWDNNEGLGIWTDYDNALEANGSCYWCSINELLSCNKTWTNIEAVKEVLTNAE